MAEYVEFKEEHPKVLMFKIGKYSTSSIEIIHLGIALIMILATLMVLNRNNIFSMGGVITFLSIYLITIGSGFLLHELAHKLTAQYYGYVSEFRGDFLMMFFALLLALTGITFLAPGAVMILANKITKRQNGIISIAGPLTNLALVIIFFIIGLVSTSPFLTTLAIVGVNVNVFLGLFNMLPIWVLDGKKVLEWNKPIYFILLTIFVCIFLFSGRLL